MPVRDGLEATRRLRASGVDAAELPIVALTANAYAEDIEACLAAGMQGHLAKPMKLGELQHIIERWGKRKTARPTPAAEVPTPGTLMEKYAERKRDTLAKIKENLGSDEIDEAELKEILDLLHKLAGTAGLFGDDRLGELASQIEHSLLAAPGESPRILSDGFPKLQAAA